MSRAQGETYVLSEDLLQIRRELEYHLLQQPYVTFVSIGFSSMQADHLLVSLGTERPDLLHVQAEGIWIFIQQYLESTRRAWNVEFQILKGRTRGDVLTSSLTV